MSDYLYFLNNLKEIKSHLQAYMRRCKVLFQLTVIVSKENLNLQLSLTFYSSITFLLESIYFRTNCREQVWSHLVINLSQVERPQFVLQKLGMKLLEMGKDMKIQHSVSSPPYKVQRNFFCKKDLCLGNKRFRKNLWGDVLHEDE